MATIQDSELRTWEDYKKAFLALLPQVMSYYDSRTIFADVCRIFCLSLRGQCTIDQKEKDAIESDYQTYVDKYGSIGMNKIARLLAYVVEALEIKRSDFLGHVYEALNATVKNFGQYFTPDSVAAVMARINLGGLHKEPGKLITLYDPTCGAGALLIESAEAFIEGGGRQGDLLLYGDDLDQTAACIAYVQFSLLGYPARIRRMNTLSQQVFDGPWYTFGWFAHCIPMRMHSQVWAEPKNCSKNSEVQNVVDVRDLVQGELF